LKNVFVFEFVTYVYPDEQPARRIAAAATRIGKRFTRPPFEASGTAMNHYPPVRP
jgi:hypothetical protein